jgi:drug/metabolite transporter (DMT)-like permease
MNNLRAHLAILIVNVIYAVSYGFSKDVLDGYIPPFAFILIRVFGAAVLFWLLAIGLKKDKVAKKDFGLLALCGLFGVAANQLMFFEGLSNTISINASVIMVATPLIVLLFSRLYLKEEIVTQKVIGVMLGMAGAVALILSNGEGKGVSVYGDLMILLNASSYAVYLVIVKPLMKKYHPYTVIRWAFSFGLLIVLPFGLSQWGDVATSFPFDIQWKIAFIIFAMTFLTYLLTVYGLNKISPTAVSAYIYIQPILATLIAVFSGAEKLTWTAVLYGLMIFVGVFLVSIPMKKKADGQKLQEGVADN